MGPVTEVAAEAGAEGAEVAASAAETAAEGVGEAAAEGASEAAAEGANSALSAENAALEEGISADKSYLSQLEGTYSTDTNYISSTDFGPGAETAPQVDVAGFIAEQDPDATLESLRGMSGAELDQVIAGIEGGDLDTVKTAFAPSPSPEQMPELAPALSPEVAAPAGAEVADPSLVERELDAHRYEQLETILAEVPEEQLADAVEQEEARQAALALSQAQAQTQTEAQAQTEAENAATTTEAEATAAQPAGPDEVPKEAATAEEGPQAVEKRAERLTEELYGGAVIYDLTDEARMLEEVPLLLAVDARTGKVTLPETKLDRKGAEKADTGARIGDAAGFGLDMGRELDHRSQTATAPNGDKAKIEQTYFEAEADSALPPNPESGLQWIAIGTLIADRPPMDEHASKLIEEVSKRIAEKLEERSKQNA